MSSNIPNVTPFLRSSRFFPDKNPQALSVQIDRAYLETAAAVNARTIGIFPTNGSVVTGETFYLQGPSSSSMGQKSQGLRQTYEFTGFTAFNHNINTQSLIIPYTLKGFFTDGTNYYPLPYVDGATATNNVGLSLSPTQVLFTTGATAPTPTYGIVIVEWVSQV